MVHRQLKSFTSEELKMKKVKIKIKLLNEKIKYKTLFILILWELKKFFQLKMILF